MRVADTPRTGRHEAWPLVVLLGGLPLWWMLGVVSLLPLALALPMAWQLLGRRRLALPRGWAWWLLFLTWVVLGVGVLGADAPAAVPGGAEGRLLVFGDRLAWYAACTIVLLWLVNLSREALADRLVLGLGAWVFVVCVLGGLLGLVAPGLEFRSAVEWVLPHGLRSNSFVASLVHPEAAELQSVLGRAAPRPKAPFAFTNTWGSVLSISLVFLAAYLATGTRSTRQRIAGGIVLLLAIPPVLYSLNRGLWLAIAAGTAGLLVLVVLRGRAALLGAVAGGLAVLAVVAALGPLQPLTGIVGERLDHQHSNERRSQLLTTTVRSVSTGSPVVGFGSTRDVQGSFASIAGSARPGCPACGVPPLGTQGQLWLVLFSQGWPGLLFFLVFVLLALARTWRCRTTAETVCTFAVGCFLLQLAVYDSLGLPLFLVMVAIGLAERERVLAGATDPALDRDDLVRRARTTVPAIAVLALAGAGAAYAIASLRDPGYLRSVSIAPTPAPVSLAGDGLDGRPITVDTESALLRAPARLTRSATVTAVPGTEVLTLSVAAPTPARATRESEAITAAYLTSRATYLADRRDRLLATLHDELDRITDAGSADPQDRQRLAAAIVRIAATDTSPGMVVRRAEPVPADGHRAEAVTSGAALGLLAGVGLIAVAPARGRRSRKGERR